MIRVDEYETIRRAYFIDGKSIRAIARERGHGRALVRQAIASPEPAPYTLKQPREAPVLGPFKARIDELLAESDSMPRKQRYTARRIYQLIQAEGYPGGESTVRAYVAEQRKTRRPGTAYLPLSFEPGRDAQVDWGEAEADIGGQRLTFQYFVMRLNYSRARFVMAFPFQKQEAFFEAHIQAFHFLGGVPHRITYDNLKTAVLEILQGRNRQEQEAFVRFRSHYLFVSNFCTPGQAHEKGGVENDIGYVRRNFMVPVPQVADFAELNALLQAACLRDTHRRLRGEEQTIAEAWEVEKPHLLPVPPIDYQAYVSLPVKPNPYSQVTFETNRYSVPTEYANRNLVLHAYPFRIEILSANDVIARHPRCFEREQDVFDPLHYLALLEQRPGAFDYAVPVRRWRAEWPAVYEHLLARLRDTWPDGRGVREFIQVLRLHETYAHDVIEQAIRRALEIGCVHYDGVLLCVRHLLAPEPDYSPLDLQAFPRLAGIGEQPVDLLVYEQLLTG